MPVRLLLAPLPLLTIAYIWFIAPYYAYLAAGAARISVTSVVLLAVTVAQLIFMRRSNASSFFLALYFVFKLLPLFMLTNVERYADSPAFIYAIVAFEILYLSYFVKFSVPNVASLYPLALALAIGAIAYTAFVLFGKLGLSALNFDLTRVYEFRGERDNIQFGPAFGYIERWANTIFLPFLLLVFVRDRRWLLAGAIIAISLVFFGLSNHKSYIAAVVAALGFFLILGLNQPERWVLRAVIGVLALVLVVDFLTGGFYAHALMTRRIFFIPARLDIGYIQAFSELGHVWWSNSVLSDFFVYPFNERYEHLIAAKVLGSQKGSANDGFLGAGFMHAGLPGIIAYSIVLSAVLAYLNGLPATKKRLAVAIVASPFMAIVTSSDLPTGMLTGGLGVALLISTMIKADRKSSVAKEAHHVRFARAKQDASGPRLRIIEPPPGYPNIQGAPATR